VAEMPAFIQGGPKKRGTLLLYILVKLKKKHFRSTSDQRCKFWHKTSLYYRLLNF